MASLTATVTEEPLVGSELSLYFPSMPNSIRCRLQAHAQVHARKGTYKSMFSLFLCLHVCLYAVCCWFICEVVLCLVLFIMFSPLAVTACRVVCTWVSFPAARPQCVQTWVYSHRKEQRKENSFPCDHIFTLCGKSQTSLRSEGPPSNNLCQKNIIKVFVKSGNTLITPLKYVQK